MLQVAGAFLVFGLLFPAGAAAQSNSPKAKATCLPGFSWSFNSEGDSPCDVAMALAGVCIGTTFNLAPLDDGFVYLGPDVPNANACRCSSVYYSVLSACAYCQDREFIDWETYKSNCSIVYSQAFAKPLPIGVGVPNYAYLNVEKFGTFNVSAASTAGGPESTRIPTATGAPFPTSGSGGKKSNTGAIAGGVVGGLVALAVIAGLVFWLLRRRANNKVPTGSYEPALVTGPAQPSPTQPHYATSSPAPQPSLTATQATGGTFGQKLYNPNDPSTFPSTNASYDPYSSSSNMGSGQIPYQPQMAQSNINAGTSQQIHPRPYYSGAAEV